MSDQVIFIDGIKITVRQAAEQTEKPQDKQLKDVLIRVKAGRKAG